MLTPLLRRLLFFFFVSSLGRASSLTCGLFLDWNLDQRLVQIEKTYPAGATLLVSDKHDAVDYPHKRFSVSARIEGGRLASIHMKDAVSDWERELSRNEASRNPEYLALSYFEGPQEYAFACWNFP